MTGVLQFGALLANLAGHRALDSTALATASGTTPTGLQAVLDRRADLPGGVHHRRDRPRHRRSYPRAGGRLRGPAGYSRPRSGGARRRPPAGRPATAPPTGRRRGRGHLGSPTPYHRPARGSPPHLPPPGRPLTHSPPGARDTKRASRAAACRRPEQRPGVGWARGQSPPRGTRTRLVSTLGDRLAAALRKH